MFTGIVEVTGCITSVEVDRTNRIFWVESPLAAQLKVDESLSHNGVCLTIEELKGTAHRISAIKETLDKTNLLEWGIGDMVNLERSMPADGRFHGHIVQGHVDGTALCTDKKEMPGSWEYTFEFNPQFTSLIIEKGAVCVNGVSLTAFKVGANSFSIAVIPYTYNHTNFSVIKKGAKVNIEFDMMGKYVLRYLEIRNDGSERQF
jgi:riboflavin synthase